MLSNPVTFVANRVYHYDHGGEKNLLEAWNATHGGWIWWHDSGKPRSSSCVPASSNGGISRRGEVASAPLACSGPDTIARASRHCLGGRDRTTASMNDDERETWKRESLTGR